MYGLVMIVKDGAADLPRCLASVRPLISHWTIIDTGSTDGTQDLIKAILNDIPGELIERPWVNFGVNRSEAFEAARGTADWLIASDADMTWEIDPDFDPDPSVDAYMIEMGRYVSYSYRLPLLLRGNLPWRSIGACHEYTALPDRWYHGTPTDKVRLDMGPQNRSSPEKTRWHAQLLKADLKRDPSNPRTVFYLAQTYREMGQPQKARKLYRQRAGMGGFAEEAFYAAYQAALLDPWPERAASLLAAWEMRPSRLEPLYALCRELNARDLHSAAYRLATVPLSLSGDILFVERPVWEWGMKFERSIAAWWVGEREEAARLNAELLASELPTHIRAAVEKNVLLTP
jgi:hypothetical protein